MIFYISLKIIKLLGLYLFSWTPYALVSMYSAIFDSDDIGPLMTTFPAMFAKFSVLWTPIVNVFGNKNISRKLFTFQQVSFGTKSLSSSLKITKNETRT